MLRVLQRGLAGLAGLWVDGLEVGHRDAFCAAVAARKNGVVVVGFRRRWEGGWMFWGRAPWKGEC